MNSKCAESIRTCVNGTTLHNCDFTDELHHRKFWVLVYEYPFPSAASSGLQRVLDLLRQGWHTLDLNSIAAAAAQSSLSAARLPPRQPTASLNFPYIPFEGSFLFLFHYPYITPINPCKKGTSNVGKSPYYTL